MVNIMLADQYGGSVGLAITQAVTLTGLLQWGIRQSAELETQMTSVERVLEYSRIEKEPSLESPPGWCTYKLCPCTCVVKYVIKYVI
jgi:ATP-binding cassette subfamily C (CFTR/MRP) protein 4